MARIQSQLPNDVPLDFMTAIEVGEVVEKSGYHQPYSHRNACTACELTTGKGAYRDVTVRLDNGTVIHFYHQTPVVVKRDGVYTLNNGGWQTSTTKERINRYTPTGYRLIQRDYEWYLETPDGRIPYENGMKIEKK